ncbi:hypothetical protein D3C85_1719560 [compost metagenome]
MSCAQLLLLKCKLRTVADISLHSFSPMADYNNRTFTPGFLHSLQNMAHHWFAAYWVEHLI